VDLREVVRRTCDDYRETFERRGVDLHLTAPPRPVTTRGDPARLAQVVGNLLHNASKFTPGGGQVTVVVGESVGRAELRVRDTGMGIPVEQLGRLFEPFVQAEQGLARTVGGLGLGLSLAKALLEMQGGTVAATSDGPGKGAEFVVTLPLVRMAPTDRPATVPKPPPRSIVIIEDNADGAATLAELLQLDGHQVQIASDGRSGLEMVQRVRPDVVLCDLGLPDLSGYDIARALRAEEALRHVRLVALSGYAQPEDRERSREAGFHHHLAKPPDLDAVNAVLADA
jgi:CheY-like chemotaxis protein